MKDKLKWKSNKLDAEYYYSTVKGGMYTIVWSRSENWWKAFYYCFEEETDTILDASRDAGYLFDYCNGHHKKLQKKLQKESKEVENKDKIEVGSEWIYKNDENQVVEVLFLGKRKVFYRDKNGNENSVLISIFKTLFTIKPEKHTAWLNVYPNLIVAHKSKEAADRHKTHRLLFQQEVEIKDPREDKNENYR